MDNYIYNDEHVNLDNEILINFNNNININNLNFSNINININSELGKLSKYYSFINSKSYLLGNNKIETDQGYILVQNLNIDIHTINKKKIVAITKKIIKEEKNLLLLKKNCIKEDLPLNDTFIDPKQKIEYNDKIMKASDFLFKYIKSGADIIKYNNIVLYNVLLQDETKININNLHIKSLKVELNEYIDLFIKKYYIKNWKNLNHDELLDYWYRFGIMMNRNMCFKLIYDNADFDDFKKKNPIFKEKNNFDIWAENYGLNNKLRIKNINFNKYRNNYKDLSKLSDSELWNHWINKGQYESRIIYFNLSFDNANLDLYKKQYSDLTNKNEIELWKHWIDVGSKENRKMNFKFTIYNADLEKYRNYYS